MKRKLLSVIFILIGIGIIIYPKLNEYYDDYKQSQMLKEWEDVMIEEKDNNLEKNNIKEDEVVKENIDNIKESNMKNREENKLEGILKIDKIDLKLPIKTGVSSENMKSSVASFTNSVNPGEIGNYSISGHRNLTYGRNFNRLDEIDKGDKIDVETKDRVYSYRVIEKLYVTPEETWVLDNNNFEEITLVTCHPIGVATHRLIIKGEILK